jgi:hypothetical protein
MKERKRGGLLHLCRQSDLLRKTGCDSLVQRGWQLRDTSLKDLTKI